MASKHWLSSSTHLRRGAHCNDDWQLWSPRDAQATGEGRAARYRGVHRVSGANSQQNHIASPGSIDIDVPTAPESREIRVQIGSPRGQRPAVGYRVGFLAAYHPNVTYYLPASLRSQLHELGRSSASDAPAGIFARGLLQRLLVDLSWSSSRLEGNTYNRLDTERLIEFGQAAEGKDAFETQMILNHKAAIEFLVNDPAHAVVTSETLIALHALLSDGLMPDPLTCGRLRKHAVEIHDSVYLPVALPQRLEELFELTVGIAGEIANPFEQAFFLMVHEPYLQPFADVNKRVSRLAANIPLIRHNLSPLSFVDVPQQA